VKKFILLFILLAEFQGPILFSQIRQTNTNGSDLAADVPFRLKKFNAENQINSIPLHLFSALFRDTHIKYCKSISNYYFWVSQNILHVYTKEDQYLWKCFRASDTEDSR